MRLQRLVPALIVFALASAMAAPALAQYRRPYRTRTFEHGYEWSFLPTFTQFQSKEDLDDDFGFGARFGYLYTPHHEIEFLWSNVSTNDSFFTSDHVDLNNFQVAYVYNFTKRDVVPYLTAALGFLHTDDHDLGTETDFDSSLGGGVRFFLGRAVYVRFEGKREFFKGDGRVFADGERFHHDEISFGIGWRLGAP